MNILRVGTDCSGIEAPIQALMQLNIPFKHVFCSDIDKFVIQSIKANYKPDTIFGDKDGPFKDGNILTRNIDNVPDIDLYIAGFPCQPFSIAGDRRGLNDPRGTVFYSCLKVIETKQPKYFILENVKGLMTHDKGNTWNIMWDLLKKLERFGYVVKWKVLNTKDYGIPQNRERLYIVGCKDKDFDWPEKKVMDDLKNYVDHDDNNIFLSTTLEKFKEKMKKIPNGSIFINLCFLKFTSFPKSNILCPCIDAQGSLYNVVKKRYANTKEKLNLQGFNLTFKQVVSDSQLNKQLGNSMSVNVLKCLLENILD